jgi:hypothetical protein
MQMVCGKRSLRAACAGLLTGLSIVLAVLPASAQVQEIWSRSRSSPGNSSARAMTVDTLGNVYVTGFSNNAANNNSDFVTVKYLADGTPAWVRSYHGPGNGDNVPTAIAINAAGEVWVTGASDAANGVAGFATIKYSADGTELWVRRLDSGTPYGSAPSALAVDGSGNAHVTGASGTDGGYSDFATVKYSPSGDQLWVRYYDGPAQNYDGATSLALDESGNVLVGGIEGGAGALGLTIKYNPDGDMLWAASFLTRESEVTGLAVDATGAIYAAGSISFYDASTSRRQMAVVKYDPNGAVIWTATYQAPGWSSLAHAVKVDSNGNVFVTGKSSGPGTIWPYLPQESIVTVKYNSAGAQLWAARYNGLPYSEPAQLLLDPAGNAFVIGSAVLTNHYGFVGIKYAPDGNQLWIAPPPTGHAFAGAIDGSGNFLMAGQFETDNPPFAAHQDFFTVKYAQTNADAGLRAFVSPSLLDAMRGSNAVFSASTTGIGPFTYQWRFNGTPIPNATNPNLAFSVLQLTNAGDYSVIVSNAMGYTIGPEARLRVHLPFAIVSPAQTNTVITGDDHTWTVVVSGETPISYQWQFNGTNLPGANNASFTLTNLQASPPGLFTVIVSNAFFGPLVSQPYRLTVISPPLSLSLRGSWLAPGPATGSAEAVRVAGHYAYLADGTAGLQVIDVSDPAHPARVGGCCAGGLADDVDVAGNRAYVADFYAGLLIVDVSDPSNPVQLGRLDPVDFGEQIAEGPNSLQVVNQFAYVIDDDGDLQIVDVSDPAHPFRVGNYFVTNGWARGLQVTGDHAYLVGSIPVGEDDEIGFLEILNLSQPATPVRIGYTETASRLYGVAVAGQFAYLVGQEPNLTVVDVTNPTTPLPVSVFDPIPPFGWSQAVQIVGHHAFLGRPDPGLMVVDVTNPADPFRLAEYRVGEEDESCDVHVVGNYAYVARGSAGLLIFEIIGPQITSVTRDGNRVALSWNSAPGLRLQRTASLIDPDWSDVPLAEGQSQATLPVGAENEFFRLTKP